MTLSSRGYSKWQRIPSNLGPFLSLADWESIDLYMGSDMFGMLDDTPPKNPHQPFIRGNLVAAGCLDAGLIDYRSENDCHDLI